ncbi:MAG: hypothetical protein WCI17_04595 [bacterium]
MNAPLQIERCPETGICSIIRADNTKVDLMPDEVAAIAAAAGRADAVRAVVGGSDEAFAAKLTPAELAQITSRLAASRS